MTALPSDTFFPLDYTIPLCCCYCYYYYFDQKYPLRKSKTWTFKHPFSFRIKKYRRVLIEPLSKQPNWQKLEGMYLSWARGLSRVLILCLEMVKLFHSSGATTLNFRHLFSFSTKFPNPFGLLRLRELSINWLNCFISRWLWSRIWISEWKCNWKNCKKFFFSNNILFTDQSTFSIRARRHPES